MSRLRPFADRGGVIGIDLGTRNALCACLKAGVPTVIPNRWGHLSTPSVVGWDEEWIVGEEAVRLGYKGMDSVWWDIKRKVGSDFSVQCDGRSWTAQEILTPLLCALREDAEAFLGEFVTSCALAVPACFSFVQREAVAGAAQAAGLRDVRIVNEPTAAALAYGRTGRFLILDFGAGTVDVSVVESEDGIWQVLESAGSAGIGGYDFDLALADWLRERLLIEPLAPSDPRWRALLSEAESVKIALSGCRSYTWQPPAFYGKEFSPLKVEREELERMMRFSIRRLTHIVRRLWEKYLPEHLLLAGGSSRIPLLREVLLRDIVKPERLYTCSEDSIALGAALYAYGGKERLLLDVLPGEVGVSWDEKDEVVIPAGTPLPFVGRSFFVPSATGKTHVRLFQDFGEEGEGRTQLAFLEIEMFAGREVLLTCVLDASGLLRVRIRHGEEETEIPIMATGRRPEIDLAVESKKKLRELKLRLTPLEIQLSPQQQDRLHLLVRAIEGLRDEDALVHAEDLAFELEKALS